MPGCPNIHQGAPECYRLDDNLYGLAEDVRQSVDIWSLGAIYSEAVVWAGSHKGALLRYRDSRQRETSQLKNFQDQGSFHDGEIVLKTVAVMHKEVMKYRRPTDYISQRVVDMMINDMLGDADERPNTKQLRKKAVNVLEYAKTAAEKRSKSPAPSVGARELQLDLPPAMRMPSAISSNTSPWLESVEPVPPIVVPKRSTTIDSSMLVTDPTTGTISTEPPKLLPARFSDIKVPTKLQEILSRPRRSHGPGRESSTYPQSPNEPSTGSMSTLDASSSPASSMTAARDQLRTQLTEAKENPRPPVVTVSEAKAFMDAKKAKKPKNSGPITLNHHSYLEELHHRDHVCPWSFS